MIISLIPTNVLTDELSCDGELHKEEELYVGLPDNNLSFAKLAANLLAGIPRTPVPDVQDPAFSVWHKEQLARLKDTIHPQVIAFNQVTTIADNIYELKSTDWMLIASQQLPATATPKSAVFLFADDGIQKMEKIINKNISENKTGHRF